MGFFKDIIADSRQPVRSAGAVAPVLDSGRYAVSTVASDLSGATDDVLGFQHGVDKAGAGGKANAGAGAVPRSQAIVSPVTPAYDHGSNPVLSSAADSMGATDASGIPHRPVGTGTTVDAQSQTILEQGLSNPVTATVAAHVATAGGESSADRLSTEAAVVDDKATSGPIGQQNAAPVPSKQPTTVSARPSRNPSTRSPDIRRPSVRVRPQASNGAHQPRTGEASCSGDLAPTSPSIPAAHSSGTEIDGATPRPPGHPGPTLTAIDQTDTAGFTPGAAPDSIRVHQAAISQTGVGVRTGEAATSPPILSTETDRAAGQRQALHTSSRGDARTPRVRIGQVNVIVEAPAAPQRRSQPASPDDLSSRLFLRNL